jgi:hypothetical protein
MFCCCHSPAVQISPCCLAAAAFAAAQARAAATSATFNQGPTYINNNKDDDCKHGCNDNDDHPSYSACQSAAAAYASGTAVSSGRGGFAFSNAEAFANAKSASFGSDEWKNNFINACSSTAYAKSTSIATSGKK